MSNSEAEQVYLKYVENYGYLPKQPSHLVAFSKLKQIKQPISFSNAKHVINNPPVNNTTNSKSTVNNISKYDDNKVNDSYSNDCIKINIEVNKGQFDDQQFNDKLSIETAYVKGEKIENILNKIERYINNKYYPIQLKIYYIQDGFTGFVTSSKLSDIGNKSITFYNKNEIKNKGLNIKVVVNYEHKIITESVTCENMIKLNSKDPLHCPIYYGMKENYEWTPQNLNHLKQFTHFTDEYGNKHACKYKDECKSYIRLENGGNKFEDECHMKLYRHPPRTRNMKLAQNINSMVIKHTDWQKSQIYNPTEKDIKLYGYNKSNGFLNALIQEVKDNDFAYDLCLQCGVNDECKHNDCSILKIVDDKMEHIRHKSVNKPLNRGEMLSLILYTGCDCNYDLCKTQRNENYEKWKWFDYCLYKAISKFAASETGAFPVFSGLNGVKLDKTNVESGEFVTYVSSSWNKKISESFMGGDNGMIIQIDPFFKDHEQVKCCDVSWISKFPDECEILFARSVVGMNAKLDSFNCVVLDDSNGVQTVSLSKRM